MKKVIRLQESDIRRMIMEAINELGGEDDDIDINPFGDKKKDDPKYRGSKAKVKKDETSKNEPSKKPWPQEDPEEYNRLFGPF